MALFYVGIMTAPDVMQVDEQMDELKATLDAIGWSAGTLARMLGCHRSLPLAWLSRRAQVPPPVEAWLLDLARFHARNPAPPNWRTRSAPSVEAAAPPAPQPGWTRTETEHGSVWHNTGVARQGAFVDRSGRMRYIDGAYVNADGDIVCPNPWTPFIQHGGIITFSSPRKPHPDVFVEHEGMLQWVDGGYVNAKGKLVRTIDQRRSARSLARPLCAYRFDLRLRIELIA